MSREGRFQLHPAAVAGFRSCGYCLPCIPGIVVAPRSLESAGSVSRTFTRTAARHRAAAHLMTLKMLKMGMYRPMTMNPMMPPMMTIMIGSMRLVSCSVVDSTSSS